MKTFALLSIFILVSSATAFSAEQPVIKSEDDRISYSVGQQVGRDLVRQRVEVDPDILLRGIMDAVNSFEPLLTLEEQVDTLAAFREKIVQTSEMRRADLKKKGEEFLLENADKEGVVTLESGLQYKVLKEGKGEIPQQTDTVRVNFVGRNVLNMQISSSYQDGVAKPAQFQVGNVLPGWGEALQMMKEGDKWELYIPYQLAFNDKGPLAWQMVIFEVELLEVIAQN